MAFSDKGDDGNAEGGASCAGGGGRAAGAEMSARQPPANPNRSQPRTLLSESAGGCWPVSPPRALAVPWATADLRRSGLLSQSSAVCGTAAASASSSSSSRSIAIGCQPAQAPLLAAKGRFREPPPRWQPPTPAPSAGPPAAPDVAGTGVDLGQDGVAPAAGSLPKLNDIQSNEGPFPDHPPGAAKAGKGASGSCTVTFLLAAGDVGEATPASWLLSRSGSVRGGLPPSSSRTMSMAAAGVVGTTGRSDAAAAAREAPASGTYTPAYLAELSATSTPATGTAEAAAALSRPPLRCARKAPLLLLPLLPLQLAPLAQPSSTADSPPFGAAGPAMPAAAALAA